MFTVKIHNPESDYTTLFQWEKVFSHGPFSPHFEMLKQDEIDRSDDEDVKQACQDFYGHINDQEGNEYWLVIGEDCYVTDMAGKTVMIMRSPEPIGGPDGWREEGSEQD